MSKRLEVTIFGTYTIVGAITFSRECAKAGISILGQKKWHSLVSDAALGILAPKKLREAERRIGHSLGNVWRVKGVEMYDEEFGLEIFWGARPIEISRIRTRNRTLQPQTVMRKCEVDDMLGVFRAERRGGIYRRWNDVDSFDAADLVISCTTLDEMTAPRPGCELAQTVTWQGRPVLQKVLGSTKPWTHKDHVFHTMPKRGKDDDS